MIQDPEKLSRMIETAQMVTKFWPFGRNEDLKIYGIFSCHKDLAQHLTTTNHAMTLFTAYNDREALAMHRRSIESMPIQIDPNTFFEWDWGVMTMSIPFQQLVPMDKVTEMMELIKSDHLKIEPEPTRAAKQAEDLIAYTRYVFEKSNASAIEMRMLERILERFKNNIPA